MTKDLIFSDAADSAQLLSEAHLESFLAEHQALGYAACKIRDKSRIIRQFVAWTHTEGVGTSKVAESHVLGYLETCKPLSEERLAFKRALLLAFLRYLRETGVASYPTACKETTPAKQIEQDFTNYLLNERGLSAKSVLVYLPPVRMFLSDCMARSKSVSLCKLNAEMIRLFVLDQLDVRTGESARLLTVALRSFLRFLFFRGVTQIDLSSTITSIRKTSGAGVHAFLSPSQVDQVLSSPDLETPIGRRDYAILLMLARLGLRAGEVVAVELDDINWRTGEITIRGKGGNHDRMPLLKDVGTALAHYLESDRGSCACRRVFLRRFAPRVGFSGPAAVGHIVRGHMNRAGVQRPPRVAAHLFRHTLATGMLHHGASLSQISEVLRHRSVTTTEIYAKVAFDSLREVARSWPDEGVVQ